MHNMGTNSRRACANRCRTSLKLHYSGFLWERNYTKQHGVPFVCLCVGDSSLSTRWPRLKQSDTVIHPFLAEIRVHIDHKWTISWMSNNTTQANRVIEVSHRFVFQIPSCWSLEQRLVFRALWPALGLCLCMFMFNDLICWKGIDSSYIFNLQ